MVGCTEEDNACGAYGGHGCSGNSGGSSEGGFKGAVGIDETFCFYLSYVQPVASAGFLDVVGPVGLASPFFVRSVFYRSAFLLGTCWPPVLIIEALLKVFSKVRVIRA